MTTKQTTSVQDYDKTLKQRQLLCLALVAAGLIGFICYGTLVPNSSLSEHAQGFYLGVSSGIFAGGLVLLWKTRRVMRSPEAKRRARIEETDERKVHILRTAVQIAGLVTFYAAVLGILIAVPISTEAYQALFAIMVVFLLSFAAASLWLNKKV